MLNSFGKQGSGQVVEVVEDEAQTVVLTHHELMAPCGIAVLLDLLRCKQQRLCKIGRAHFGIFYPRAAGPGRSTPDAWQPFVVQSIDKCDRRDIMIAEAKGDGVAAPFGHALAGDEAGALEYSEAAINAGTVRKAPLLLCILDDKSARQERRNRHQLAAVECGKFSFVAAGWRRVLDTSRIK